MNLKTFMAMLWRDAHVARRNFMQLAFQVLMQPMMFVFVFGRVMTTSGIMSPAYKSLLLLGCSVPQGQIGLMFSLVVAPMIFFGCTYYPWQALERFTILRWVVLINPLVYASEGFRSALVPAFPHLPSALILMGLLLFNV